MHPVLGVDHPDKAPFTAGLYRRRGNQQHRRLAGDLQAQVDELIGEQAIVLIIEAGLDLQGSGRGVYLVVQAEQMAGRQALAIAAIPGFGNQRSLALQRLLQAGNIPLR